jgi:hypothetical protein
VRAGHDAPGTVLVPRAHLMGMNEMTQIAPTYLTQPELAEFLRVSERTLEDWRVTHSGPPYSKLGRHVRYNIDDVVVWVREQRRG